MFYLFILKQQFQALHKKIRTTPPCALRLWEELNNVTHQVQLTTTGPIKRFRDI